ncbi:MAG: T9SS type A sorting domain-containing protein [Chitinophagales bacterium]|nr:T9SS type A sorting domain-containing protein [Chitinophagales bacterium]
MPCCIILSLRRKVGFASVLKNGPQVNLFPNPFAEQATVNFAVTDYMDCTFNLYDINGRLVKTLLDEQVKPGTNRFTFSLKYLVPGNYELIISSGSKFISSKKIIKE